MVVAIDRPKLEGNVAVGGDPMLEVWDSAGAH
jgi:hypothetical protein